MLNDNIKLLSISDLSDQRICIGVVVRVNHVKHVTLSRNMYQHIIMKSSLNSYRKQVHQYQQNEQPLSTQVTEHENEITTYGVGNPGPGLEQTQKYGRG